MDIAKFIQNLQQKSEPAKKLILWASTAVIMLVIGSGWMVSLRNRDMTLSQNQTQKKSSANIFQNFKKDMGSLINKIPTHRTEDSKNPQEEKPKNNSSSTEKTKINKNKTEQKDESDQNEQTYKLPLSN